MISSFPPIAGPQSRILILGTMPGAKSLQLSQYYGNAGNSLWKILFAICDEPFSSQYEDKVSLVLKHNLALWDVLQSCNRQGSSDANIQNEIPNNFQDFFENYPSIRHIFFNGTNAAKYFKKYVSPLISLSKFSFYTLPSTSPANNTITFSHKEKQWSLIRDVLSCHSV